MWHPQVYVGSVKDKIQSHSWLLLSLDLPSASDILLSLCSVLPQKILRAVPNSDVKQRCKLRSCGQTHWCIYRMTVPWGWNGHYASGFKTKLRYPCSPAQCRCFVYFPQSVRREVLSKGNAHYLSSCLSQDGLSHPFKDYASLWVLQNFSKA